MALTGKQSLNIHDLIHYLLRSYFGLMCNFGLIRLWEDTELFFFVVLKQKAKAVWASQERTQKRCIVWRQFASSLISVSLQKGSEKEEKC